MPKGKKRTDMDMMLERKVQRAVDRSTERMIRTIRDSKVKPGERSGFEYRYPNTKGSV